MASKKGILLTIGILVAITIASFVFWFLPQNSNVTFVVSDFESHLDGVNNIHGAISETVDENFQNLLNEKISTQEYIEQAERSSVQVKSQIIQLVESQATNEWHASYSHYVEALKQYNTYLRETIVAATMIEDGVDPFEIDKFIIEINQFQENAKYHILESNSARP